MPGDSAAVSAETKPSGPRVRWATHFGSLSVAVIEGLDLFESSADKRRSIIRPRHTQVQAVLIKIALQTEDSEVLKEFTCRVLHNDSQKSSMTIQEEFQFDDAQSTFNLMLTLHRLNESGIMVDGGAISIPVHRLRSNYSVEQYYPFEKNGSLLRSSVLLRLNFTLDSVKIHSPSPAVTPLGRDSAEKDPASSLQLEKYEGPLLSPRPKGTSSGTPKQLPIKSSFIPTGLVDYCVIIGPRIIETASRSSTPRGVRAKNNAPDENDTQSVESVNLRMGKPTVQVMRQVDPIPDVVRASEREFERGPEACIYERFPEQDYPEIALPTKVEWFCFPNGAPFIANASRPGVHKQCFVMRNADESTQGLSLCFYVLWPDRWIEGSPRAVPDPKHARHSRAESNASSVYESASSAESIDQTRTWMPLCVCLLTRAPFVQQLCILMDNIYTQLIEPKLSQYEVSLATSSSLSEFASTQRFLSLLYPFEYHLVQLCLEAPLPVPGCFDVGINMFGSDFVFELDSKGSLPTCPYAIREAARLIGSSTLVDIICCALNECKILLHSTNLSILPCICETVKTLMYPLQWEHVYVPVLPYLLLDLVQAPLPYIIGVHTSWIDKIRPEALRDVVLVNCDTGDVEMSHLPIEPLPPNYHRWLCVCLRSLVEPVTLLDTTTDLADTIRRNDAVSGPMGLSADQVIQLLFVDMHTHMFLSLPKCLFFLGTSNTPVFNRSSFLNELKAGALFDMSQSEKTSVTHFMMKIIDSQAFHRMIECVQDGYLDFFFRAIAILGKFVDQPRSPSRSLRQPSANSVNPVVSSSPSFILPIVEDMDSLITLQNMMTERLFLYKPMCEKGNLPLFKVEPFILPNPDEIPSPCGDFRYGQPSAYLQTQAWSANAQGEDDTVKTLLEKEPSETSGTKSVLSDDAISKDAITEGKPEAESIDALQNHIDQQNDLVPQMKSNDAQTVAELESVCLTDGGALEPEVINSPGDDEVEIVLFGDGEKIFERSELVEKSYGDSRLQTPSRRPPLSDAQNLMLQISPRYNDTVKRGAPRSGIHRASSHAGGLRAITLTLNRTLNSMKPRRSLGEYELEKTIQRVEEKILKGAGAGGVRDTGSDASVHLAPTPSSKGGRSTFTDNASNENFVLEYEGEGDNPMDSLDDLASRVLSVTGDADEQAQLSSLGGLPGANISTCFSLMTFHWPTLVECRDNVSVWTVEDIISILRLDEDVALAAVADLGENGDHSTANVLKKRWQLEDDINSLKHTEKSLLRGSGPSKQEQDDHRIQSCLATAFSASNLSDEDVNTKTSECAPVLANKSSRAKFLDMMRQPQQSKLASSGLRVFPLHKPAFEVLARLCTYFLKSCSDNDDFISAYHILAAAGCYYQMLDVRDYSNVDFLSARICHHTIYQNIELWRALLWDNLGLGDPRPKDTDGMTPAGTVNRSRVAQETKSVLYEMCYTGVNKERAILFCQTIASEFRLDLDQYLALQRYAKKLYKTDPSQELSSQQTTPLLENEEPELEQDECAVDIPAQKAHLDSFKANSANSANSPPQPNPETAESKATVHQERESSAPTTNYPNSQQSAEGSKSELNIDTGTETATSRTHELVDGRNPLHGVILHAQESRVRAQSQTESTNNRKPGSGHQSSEESPHDSQTQSTKRFSACVVEGGGTANAVCALDMLGNWLVSATARGDLQVIDMDEKCVVAEPNAHAGRITSVMCTPLGIITTGADRFLKIWKYPWLPDIISPSSAVCRWGSIAEFVSNQDALFEEPESVEASKPRQRSASANTYTVGADVALMSHRAEGRTLLNVSRTVSSFRLGLHSLQAHQHPICALDYVLNDDGSSLIASADVGGVVRVWEGSSASELQCTMTGTLLSGLSCVLLCTNKDQSYARRHGAQSRSPAPNGETDSRIRTQSNTRAHLCVTGTIDGRLAVFDIVGKKCMFSAQGHTRSVTSIRQVRDSEILTCAADRMLRLWDVRTERSSMVIVGHQGPVTCMEVAGWNDTLVVTGSADGLVRVWDTRHDVTVPCATLSGHTDSISGLQWDGSGLLLSSSYDGSVREWDVINCVCVCALQSHSMSGVTAFAAHTAPVHGLSVYPFRSPTLSHMTRVATGSWDGSVRLWERLFNTTV